MAIIIGTHPPSWLRNCTRCSAAAVVLFIVLVRQKGKMSGALRGVGGRGLIDRAKKVHTLELLWLAWGHSPK